MLAAALVAAACVGVPTFDVANDRYVKDGEPVQLRAGSFHYSRAPAVLWADRLARMKALGLNAVQTYVPWNWHEKDEGKWTWDGDHDLGAFLGACKDADMMVLLRLGPYMCGEWEFGGFPAWLITKNVTLRTYEDNYIRYVDKYFAALFDQVRPHLYENGGHVVLVQVENEFGSYGNVESNPADKKYMQHLVDLVRSGLSNRTLIYTTDGGSLGYMKHGSLPGGDVITTGDGGFACDAMKQMNPAGRSPCQNSELYTGWLTHWGENMANTSSSGLAGLVESGMKQNYSFSLYMAFGGSNFGFFAGSNGGGASIQPHITSYDYDSPISENGAEGYGSDGANKAEALRTMMSKYLGALPPMPPAPARKAYGTVKLTGYAALRDSAVLKVLSRGSAGTQVPTPVSIEMVGQNYGLAMYSTKAPAAGDKLSVPSGNYVRDYAQVFVDRRRVPGAMFRGETQSLSGLSAAAGSTVDVLVEAMGRLNFGRGMYDPKGLVTPLELDGKQLPGPWTILSLPLEPEDIAALPFTPLGTAPADGPTFFQGTLEIQGTPVDTYFHSGGWTKGYVWVNGVNLGRYWETRGPQHTLYIPATFLKTGHNTVVVLELERPRAALQAVFVADPDFSGAPLPTCEPVAAGAPVVMEKCALPDNQQFAKTAVAGGFTLSLGGLCVTAGSADPSMATMQPCVAGDKSQVISQSDVELKVASSGHCLDIFGGKKGSNQKLDWYPCGGQWNQKWSLHEQANHDFTVQSTGEELCITACQVKI